MAKLISNFVEELNKAIKTALQTKVIGIVQKQLSDDLNSNKSSDGSPQPKKAPSTIRQYKKKGFDTKNWLKASGEATKLKATVTKQGITITPADPKDVLKYHSEDAQDLFSLDNDTIAQIKTILTKGE